MIDTMMQIAYGVALVSMTLTVGCYGGVKLLTVAIKEK